MMPNFDPSKMDPRALTELTELVRQLPPEQIARMQQIMQKMMVGIDVRYELEQLERELPPGFREKLMALSGGFGGMGFGGGAAPAPFDTAAEEISEEISDAEFTEEEGTVTASAASGPMDLRAARLTVLRAVAEGEMTPEEAERILWPES